MDRSFDMVKGLAKLSEAMSHEELMLSNCGAGEDSLEFLGQQGDQISQSTRRKPDLKETRAPQCSSKHCL